MVQAFEATDQRARRGVPYPKAYSAGIDIISCHQPGAVGCNQYRFRVPVGARIEGADQVTVGRVPDAYDTRSVDTGYPTTVGGDCNAPHTPGMPEHSTQQRRV